MFMDVNMINNYEVVLGTGKTTSMALSTMYDFYIVDRASWLADMRRIPRKLKKRMFKNIRIKSLYKELKGKGNKDE